MKTKNNLRKITLILGLLALVVSCSFFSKYDKEDLSQQAPFNDIIGKTLSTKQICYITKNAESIVKENPYIVQMDTDFIAPQGEVYTLPIGTELQIEKTIYFIKPPGQFAYKNVLGSVYLVELNQNVKFEFEWEPQVPENMGADRYQYEIYPLAPWQEKPLPFKYKITDNTVSPYH